MLIIALEEKGSDIIKFTDLIMPLLVLFIVFYGIIKKVDVYDEFVDGAKEGLQIGISIFPYLLGMILGTNILLKSGLLNLVFKLISPMLNFLKFPFEVFPLAILRPISGNASLSMLNMILANYGADSFVGRVASTMQGSTDTTIYILTLYFGSIGIKKTKYALKVGLLADLAGILASIFIVSLIFGK